MSSHQLIVDEGLVPSPEDESRREVAIKKIKQVFLLNIYFYSISSLYSFYFFRNVLSSVHSPESDIDALCVAPFSASMAKNLFVCLHDMLKKRREVSEIHCVKGAKMPLMRFEFDSISIDLPYAQLKVLYIPEESEIRKRRREHRRSLNRNKVLWLKFSNNILATMKFKKGTKVEVLSKKVPSGSWRCAEIIFGNGHHYAVRYDGYDGTHSEEIVERVPRKSIRPCPPVLEVTENWRPGDVVEVCKNSSWSMATVLKVLGKGYILVRLLGSSLEFKMNKFDIRLRQSWLDGKWIVVGKGTSRCENGKRDDTLAPRLYLMSSAQVQKTTLKTKRSFDYGYLYDKKNVNFLNSNLGSKSLKRSSHSQVELYAEPPLKLRATNNKGRYQRARVAYPSMLPKQVDGAAFQRDIQVEEYRENFETNDFDEVSSSVCSCSINVFNLNIARYPVSTSLAEDLEGASSDAESACHSRYEEGNDSPLSEEEMAAEIHRLELHAYRCTIEALHASGPLSWELEALMTNLRLSLHISNDEHLMEIRNLISSQNSIPVK